MEEKLISVIVPVYNVEKYLDKCIKSIVNQTYKNLEIILVDDGSPDNCPEICDKWAKKDERIKVIHKENGGLSDARNAGFAVSKGEYISFIDSDDFIEKGFYEILCDALDNGADIAECATRLCDEDNNIILVRGFEEDKMFDGVTATQTLLEERGIMQTVWNKLYKREVIRNILFEYGKYHEDNFWTWQIFLNAKKVFVSSKAMYNYVQRNGSIMGDGYSLKRLDGLEAIYKCYETLFNDDNYHSIVVNKFVGSCLFDLQSIYKFLEGADRKKAIKTVFYYIKRSKVKRYKNELASLWNKLFIRLPRTTAKMRAITGMGF